jgi:hypothetical protein
VSTLIDQQQFADFVLAYQHTAFRLEQRDDQYYEPEEEDPFRRFLDGGPATATGWNDEWEEMLRRRALDGQRMIRVRIVAKPHTDYTRFLLALAAVNVPAGEDIRYLPQTQAVGLDLPQYDFWLIDSRKLAILRFAEDNTLLGAEIHEDPAVVVRHCYYRDVACHYAVPFAEYIS